MVSLKESLKGKLTDDELEILPRSFDIVGNILIFSEFPEQLEKKKGIISEAVMALNPNIKTVARKAGLHKGVYRTKKVEVIGGEETKEGICRENGALLKVNVENSYFSPRLSTERLRIAKMVQPGEEVLVMFSGVGPYPMSMVKNASPKSVYGVEINPNAHKYALENARINKASNVFFYNGNVKKVVPKILEERAPLIGIKSWWPLNQLKSRLKLNPKLIEIHLKEGDLEEKLIEIERILKMLRNKGIRVMLHQPNTYNGVILQPGIKPAMKSTRECYKRLYRLSLKYRLEGFIIHPIWYRRAHLNHDTFVRTFTEIAKSCKYFSKYAFIENSVSPGGIRELQELKELAGLENVCIDITHAYMEMQNTDKIVEYAKSIKAERKYFHINDSIGSWSSRDHTREIGKGKIEFEKLIPYIYYGMIEVMSKDEIKGKEEISSYRKYLKMIEGMEKFDRVVMPLPKGAESFLEEALAAVKKKGMIHFYDFAHESEIPKSSLNKIKKHCKAKIINVIKCGQYSPGKYRVCVDFQPL